MLLLILSRIAATPGVPSADIILVCCGITSEDAPCVDLASATNRLTIANRCRPMRATHGCDVTGANFCPRISKFETAKMAVIAGLRKRFLHIIHENFPTKF